MVYNNIKDFFTIKFSENRIYGLDILRALAILEVVFAHGQTFLPNKYGIIHKLFGFDGVTLFFVLSGFLIGGILIRTIENQRISAKTLFHFWNRRWWRTLPNYYLVLIFLLIHHALTKDLSVLSHAQYFIFSQNLFFNHPSFFGEAWSLSVEEWFYLLIPIMIFLAIAKIKLAKLDAFSIIIGLIIFLALLYRIFKFYYLYTEGQYNFDPGKAFGMQVFSRLDSVMFGVLGAYVFHRFPTFWHQKKRKLFWVGVTLIILIQASKFVTDSHSFYRCVILWTILPFSFLSLFPFFNTMKYGSGRIYKIVTRISLISYSMYLLNLNIVYWIIVQNMPWDLLELGYKSISFLKFFSFWFITIVLSIILYKYYEVPMTSLRAKNQPV